MFERGSIVYVDFPLPQGLIQEHPAVIISSEELFNLEGTYICLMITSREINDGFSYILGSDNTKVTVPMTLTTSRVRCNLVSVISERQIRRQHGTLRPRYLKELLALFFEVSLSLEDVSFLVRE